LETGTVLGDDEVGFTPAAPSGGGRSKGRRRCALSRKVEERSRLIRFVAAPDGLILPDPEASLPGRGMWLSADRDVVNKAVAKGLFGRAAKRSVQIPEDLADRVERLLSRRLFDGLGLARRAGQIVMGFDQVQAALTSGTATVLLAAADGAEDGRRKLRHLAPELPLIRAGGRDELGAALGRESLVHAAVLPGKLARRLLHDAGRLAGFRPDVVVEVGVEPGQEPEAAPEPKVTQIDETSSQSSRRE
jgi:predicted RNA-binding protein YlxR (DUF448 family)/ribosomal protein L30E